MQQSFSTQSWRWLIHLFFWVLIGAANYLVYYRILGNEAISQAATLINLIGFVILVYGHLGFLLPKLFKQQKYLAYATGTALLLVATTCLRFFLGWWMVQQQSWPIEEQFSPSFFGNMLFGGSFFLLLSTPLYLIDNWFKKLELEQALKTHQLEAELRFLKAQVNPHFLFNALNNIYALSFTGSPQTPNMILKLSDMMSYMLYDCKSEMVALEAEIQYLHNYIALQQLKKEGEMQVAFSVSPVLSQRRITPMLFIPFFENAFKHGNLEDTKNGWLKAQLSEKDGALHFKIKNSFREAKATDNQLGGVGLTNIHQRLALLYPERHQLKIHQEKGVFHVFLQLDPIV